MGWVEPPQMGEEAGRACCPANSDQVIAFNIMIRGRIQLFTASLDLS